MFLNVQTIKDAVQPDAGFVFCQSALSNVCNYCDRNVDDTHTITKVHITQRSHVSNQIPTPREY